MRTYTAAHATGAGTQESQYIASAHHTITGTPTTIGSMTDHSYDGDDIIGTAGEALTIGQVCYLKSDGKLWKANANANTTVPALYMAMASISANATGVFLKKGYIRDDSLFTFTVGTLLYLDSTAGVITGTVPSTVGYQVQVVGQAYAAHIVEFCPVPISFEVVSPP